MYIFRRKPDPGTCLANRGRPGAAFNSPGQRTLEAVRLIEYINAASKHKHQAKGRKNGQRMSFDEMIDV